MIYETPSSAMVTLALAWACTGSGSLGSVALWIWRKAGWESEELGLGLGLGFLEYLDFLPGMEGEEGDEGVPMDLKVSLLLVIVVVVVAVS